MSHYANYAAIMIGIVVTTVVAGCRTDGNGLIASGGGPDYKQLLDGTDSDRETSIEKRRGDTGDVAAQASALRTLQDGENFSEIVHAAPGVVLVDFYADWCGPCQKQSIVLHDVEEYASKVNAQIIKVNVDNHRDLARQYQVESLPTLVVLRDGKPTDVKTGYTHRRQIESLLR